MTLQAANGPAEAQRRGGETMTRCPFHHFTRRRLLAAAVAAACGWAAPPLLRSLAAAPRRRPVELPLAAVDLYAPHDLAG